MQIFTQPTIEALTGSFTSGSIPFAGSSGALTESNANLRYDLTNQRLYLGQVSATRVSVRFDNVESDLAPLTISVGNLTFNAVKEASMYIGYNTKADGTLVSATEPGWSIGIESRYNDGTAAVKQELYVQYTRISGTFAGSGLGYARPFFLQWDRTNQVHAQTIIATPLYFMAADCFTRVAYIDNTLGMTFESLPIVFLTNNANAVLQRNAAGNANVSLLKLNASNQVEIGSSNITKLTSHLSMGTDNTFSIGSLTGSTPRPMSVFAGTSINIATQATTSSTLNIGQTSTTEGIAISIENSGVQTLNGLNMIYFRNTGVTDNNGGAVKIGSVVDSATGGTRRTGFVVYTSNQTGTLFREALRITGSGVMYGLDGAVTTPYYSFSTDTDTGIYHSGTDTVAFAGGGVLCARAVLSSTTRTFVVGDGTNTASLITDAAAATSRDHNFQTAGTNRWIIRCNAVVETGSNNIGSDLQINRRNDAGADLGACIYMSRSTGGVSIGPNSTIAASGLSVLLQDGTTSTGATRVGVKAGAGQSTTNLLDFLDSSGAVIGSFGPLGAWKPPTIADASATNNSVYYSSTGSKLVYKDSGGVVNNLY